MKGIQNLMMSLGFVNNPPSNLFIVHRTKRHCRDRISRSDYQGRGGSLKLPEKDFFTISEIAERWSCDEELVDHYVEVGKLIPSIRLDGIEGRLWRKGFLGSQSEPVLIEEKSVVGGLLHILNYPQLQKSWDDEVGLCFELGRAMLISDDMAPDHWFEVSLRSCGSYSAVADSFLVCRKERDRFENENSAAKLSEASMRLRQDIREENFTELEVEFRRAVDNIEGDPASSITAACNILEALFRRLIRQLNLELPKKLTVKPLWMVVQQGLDLRPGDKEDPDIKRILGGMASIVDGIAAFRTHSGSAHGGGELRYQVSPRHARLTVNAAHSLAQFVIETWKERRRAVE